MKQVLFAVAVLSILLSFCFSAHQGRSIAHHSSLASVVIVDDGGSIQEAINDAPEGSTILVGNGTFNEHLEITKPLKIYGSGAASTILRSDWTGDVVLVYRANNVTFSGFQIEGTVGSFASGIHIKQSQHIQILNNSVSDNRYGIYFWDSSNVTMRNNSMINNSWNFGIWGLLIEHFLHCIDNSNTVDYRSICYWINQENKTVPSNAGYLGLVNSTNIVVNNLNFSRNFQGILSVHSTNITFQGNIFRNNYYGIHMAYISNNNTIIQNAFSSNTVGVMLDLSSRNCIEKNVFSGNTKGLTLSYSPLAPNLQCVENYINQNNFTQNNDGIMVLNSTRNTFCGNLITSSTRYGVILSSGSCANSFYGNTILSSNYGLAIQRSNDNTIYNNNFINNVQHVYTETSTNTWNSTKNIGGNFWSNTITLDTDLDGISDLPYEIDTLNVDRHPLAGRFYNHTFSWKGQSFFLTSISNSSDLHFEFIPQESKAILDFSGLDKTIGFCRANLPKNLVQTFWDENLTILVNYEHPSYMRSWEDSFSVYLYFYISHPASQVVIIPEFSSPLLLIKVLSLVFLFRNAIAVKKHSKAVSRNKEFAA